MRSAALRLAVRAAATALLLLPLVRVAMLLARDLNERPTGRVSIEMPSGSAVVRLVPSHDVALALPPARFQYRFLIMHGARDHPRRGTLRICAAALCESHSVAVGGSDALMLPIPGTPIGGEIVLTALEAEGGELILGAPGGASPFEAVQGYSWRLPLRRGRQVFAASAGADLFWITFVAYGAMLITAAAIAIWRGLSDRSAVTTPKDIQM